MKRILMTIFVILLFSGCISFKKTGEAAGTGYGDCQSDDDCNKCTQYCNELKKCAERQPKMKSCPDGSCIRDSGCCSQADCTDCKVCVGNECLPSGLDKCADGRCLPYGIEGCHCTPSCDPCTQECREVEKGKWDCIDVPWVYCNNGCECSLVGKDLYCEENCVNEVYPEGCKYCTEHCYFGRCFPYTSEHEMEICPDNSCHPKGQCPVQCNPPCDSCTQDCKEETGYGKRCVSSGKKRCPDGSCVSKKDRCPPCQIF